MLHLVKQATVGKMLDDMQKLEVTKETDSPWSSPIIVIQKWT
jgi:hypothetical protein